MKTTNTLNTIKNVVISIIVIGFAMFLQSCGPAEHTMPSQGIPSVVGFSKPATFTEIKDLILQPKCYSCHSVGYYDFTSYEGVTRRVVAGSANNSLLYQRVANFSMPLTGEPLSSDEINAISSWIESGAPNN